VKLPKVSLWALTGATVELVLLAGLAYWMVQTKPIRYYTPAPPVVGGRVLSPAELAQGESECFGPAPGWQLYDVPIEAYAPHLNVTVALVGAAYVVLIACAAWRKRRLAAACWLSPLVLWPAVFFALAFLMRPTILY
jgi:hypothetical protein